MSVLLRAAAMLSGFSALSFVSAGTAGTGSNPTAALPAGWSAGNLLVVAGTSNNTWSNPAGWNISTNAAGNQNLFLAWKIATAGETNLAMTNAGADSLCVMLCYKNGTASVNQGGTVASGNSLTPATNSLTTTVNDALVISVYGSKDNGITWTSPPASTTARATVYNGTTSLLLVVDEVKTIAGATTARTATPSAIVNWESYAVAFRN